MKRDKIIIIILAVVVVFLALTVTLLLFKIRDMYYEDFDEDDEDEYDLRRPQNHESRTVKPVQKERPAARPRPSGSQNRPANGQPRQGGAQNRPVNGRQTGPQNRGGSGTVKEAGWKPKNFMMEEDDMEFEFLNWDGEER